MGELNIQVRIANIDDIELILSFISQKANFDGFAESIEPRSHFSS
jgi:hypothetical protein